MEKSTRIVAQIYGYAVCLVAVITFLISVTALVNAILDRNDPLHSGFNQAGTPSLASYDNYKMDILKTFQKGEDKNNEMAIPSEEKLKAMYEAARDYKIRSEQHTANKTMSISGIMILVSMTLFITHWRWLRKLYKTQ